MADLSAALMGAGQMMDAKQRNALAEKQMIMGQAQDLQKQGLMWQTDESGKPVSDPNTGLLQLTPESEQKRQGLIKQGQSDAATKAATDAANRVKSEGEATIIQKKLGNGQGRIETADPVEKQRLQAAAAGLSSVQALRKAASVLPEGGLLEHPINALKRYSEVNDWTPGTSDFAAASNSLIPNLKIIRGRAGGGNSELGREYNEKELPGAGDTPEMRAQKLDRLEALFTNELKGSGISPQTATQLGYIKSTPPGLMPSGKPSSMANDQPISVKSITPEDRSAINWAKSNSKDPRAIQILKMHGL